MVNNKCVVDCVYCYADIVKDKHLQLPIDIFDKLLKECVELQVVNIDLTGGDIFLHPKWEYILTTLIKMNYRPYLSTKVPITKKIISVLNDIGVKKIQISIDTVVNTDADILYGIDSEAYLEKVKQGFKLLDENDIKINVKVVLTKYNSSISALKEMLSFFEKFKNIEEILISDSYKSRFKGEGYVMSDEQFRGVYDFLSKKERIIFEHKRANFSKLSEVDAYMQHNSRTGCPGNVKSLNILPDGNVNLCEQMYWHEDFIFGNLKHDSLLDIWNSEKALSLWNISQKNISVDSPCKNCTVFSECRRGLGVCWSEVIKEYGERNIDYPYPNCPHAKKGV